MRIKITKPGIYGGDGPVELRTEIEVDEAPKGWTGKYEVVSDTKGKTPVTNPKKAD